MMNSNNSLTQFTITSHNICGINSLETRTEIAIFLHDNQPAVLMLQEPKLDSATPVPPMKHYHAIYFSHPHQNTGIIMYIHHSVSYHILSDIPHAAPYHPHNSSTVVGFVWLSSPILSQPIVVGGVYLSHQAVEGDVRTLTHMISRASQPLPTSPPFSPSLPVFLLGDFNSRHPAWDREMRTTPHGLNKWIHQHMLATSATTINTHMPPLCLVNNHFASARHHHTHVNTSHYMESVLDLAIATRAHVNMIADMQILTDASIHSDHYPISIKFNTLASPLHNQTIHAQEESGQRVKWKTDAGQEKWTMFKELVQQSLPKWVDEYQQYNTAESPHLTQQMMDTCWQKLTNIMTTAAHNSIGTHAISTKHKEWWGKDPNIPALHRRQRKARNRVQQLQKRMVDNPQSRSTPVLIAEAKRNLVTAKREFDNTVRACRIQCLEELAASLDDGRHKLLWSVWKRLAASPRIPMALVPDMHTKAPPSSLQQSINNMATHLASISTQSSSVGSTEEQMQQEHVREYLSRIPSIPNVSSSPLFTQKDVTEFCLSFRLHTAIGSDNISPYMLRHGGDRLHQALFLLFSICSRHGLIPASFKHAHVVTLYKGDGNVNDANNYRPISITSIIARMYERLHMKSLLQHMKNSGIPSPSQFGFTKHRSTHDAIYRLLSTIVDTMGTGIGNFIPTVFVDISKAYDKVWIDGLLYMTAIYRDHCSTCSEPC